MEFLFFPVVFNSPLCIIAAITSGPLKVSPHSFAAALDVNGIYKNREKKRKSVIWAFHCRIAAPLKKNAVFENRKFSKRARNT